MTAQCEVEKNCQKYVTKQSCGGKQSKIGSAFPGNSSLSGCHFSATLICPSSPMSMSCAKADVRISDDLQLENSTSTSVWTTYLNAMPDFPLLVGIYAIAWECWPAEVHFSWILHRNKNWHGQYISWTSHICSRGFPYSPFERNNHNSDIIMVFSAVPLRYI